MKRLIRQIFVGFFLAAAASGTVFAQRHSGRCGDGTCDEIEQRLNKCPQDCSTREPEIEESGKESARKSPKIIPAGQKALLEYSVDSDGFLWGTEVWPDQLDLSQGVINETLRTKYLKIRLGISNVSSDGKTFSPVACFPSAGNCRKEWDIDEISEVFRQNGWSMIPMLSFGYHGINSAATSEDMQKYVNFVDWFVSRYKESAAIKYLELENCPNCALSMPVSAELLVETTNRIYNLLKQKFPDLMIGTAGFEHWIDQDDDRMSKVLDYFLEKTNNAKFDFFAFHGYPLSEKAERITPIPPTKKPAYNKYAGIPGIINIREKLDANGWQDRLMIDTEHGTIFPGASYSAEKEQIDAAYYLQELLLKRVQQVGARFALAGIFPMKIRTRENIPGVVGDMTAGDLDSSGRPYLTVKATSLFWSKLKVYSYSGHVSGEFDQEDQAWVERFQSGNKELYVFFKPFKYRKGSTVSFDYEKLEYKLSLDKEPVSVVLTDMSGSEKLLSPGKDVLIEAENSPQFLEVEF